MQRVLSSEDVNVSTYFTIFVFVAFMLMGYIFILQLFIAAVLEGFAQDEGDSLEEMKEDLLFDEILLNVDKKKKKSTQSNVVSEYTKGQRSKSIVTKLESNPKAAKLLDELKGKHNTIYMPTAASNLEKANIGGGLGVLQSVKQLAAYLYCDIMPTLHAFLGCVIIVFEEPKLYTVTSNTNDIIIKILGWADITWTVALALLFVPDAVKLYLKRNRVQDEPQTTRGSTASFSSNILRKLDIFVLIVSVCGIFCNPMIFPSAQTGYPFGILLRIGKMSKIFRVLSVFLTYERMKDMIDGVAAGAPSVVSVLAFFFLTLYIFATFGRALFAHKIKDCNDMDKEEEVCRGIFFDSDSKKFSSLHYYCNLIYMISIYAQNFT